MVPPARHDLSLEEYEILRWMILPIPWSIQSEMRPGSGLA